MRLRLVVVTVSLGLTLLPGCARFNDHLAAGEAATPKQMLARQVLVTLPDSLKPKWESIKKELANTNSLEETGEFPLTAINVDCLVYKVPKQQAIGAVLEKLNADRRVVLAQENQIFEGIQGGESDALAAISYAPKAIRADAAHRVTTGKGVKVAVIDTGAEKEHPDLKGRLAHTANFVEGGDLSFNRDRHGTAVAGVIGARSGDDAGIYGIAPEADINVYKACWYPDQTGAKAMCSSWTLAKALDAAIGAGANIVNLSLAGPEDELMGMLLGKAHAKGIHVVAAALEDQASPGFPAQLPFAIPVISSGPDNRQVNKVSWLAQYTNTAVAPGLDILTTVPKEGYDFVTGSSLATAHVSGSLALLLSLKPGLTPDQMLDLMRRSAQKRADGAPDVLDVCAMIKNLQNGAGC